MRPSYNLAIFAAAGCLIVPSQTHAANISYSFVDLGAAGGQSFARGINNAGEVAGYSLPANSSGLAYRATIWHGATATDLGTLGGSYSQAFDINGSGQAVGNSELSDYHTQRAAVWSGTTGIGLNTPADNHSEGEAINDAGHVAGAIFSATEPRHAAVWNGTTPTDLGTLGGQTSQARSINNGGQVVGDSYLSDNSTNHATLWNGTAPTDLGTLGGKNSTANDINDKGEIAGYSYLAGDTVYHAAVWNGAAPPADLSTLGGGSSEGNAINDAGTVVGWSETSSGATHAVLWNGTTATDLNSFLDASTVNAGWVLQRAYDINAHGWIVGDAHNTLSNADHAFLLAPIPEPETYVMFMAGLGLIANQIWRRRTAGIA